MHGRTDYASSTRPMSLQTCRRKVTSRKTEVSGFHGRVQPQKSMHTLYNLPAGDGGFVDTAMCTSLVVAGGAHRSCPA